MNYGPASASRRESFPSVTTVTFGEVIDRFLRQYTERTRDTYSTHLRRIDEGFGPICDQMCERCLQSTNFTCECDCTKCRKSVLVIKGHGPEVFCDRTCSRWLVEDLAKIMHPAVLRKIHRFGRT